MIRDHLEVRALRAQDMPDVAPLLERLEIPARFWELVEPQALD